MDDKTRSPTAVDVSLTAEAHQARNQPDPFPPEGTDEKALSKSGEQPLSETDRLKATEAALHRKP